MAGPAWLVKELSKYNSFLKVCSLRRQKKPGNQRGQQPSLLRNNQLITMIVNLYQALKNFPVLSKQLHCRDMLFTNYDCPQAVKKQRFFVECNYIAYVISGKRVFHNRYQSWELKEGVCVFVKKGTHIAEMEEGEGWCVMVFFIPDHFLKQLLTENNNSLSKATVAEGCLDHVLNLHVNDLSQSFFASMLPYFTQTPSPSEILLELKFKELVLSL